MYSVLGHALVTLMQFIYYWDSGTTILLFIMSRPFLTGKFPSSLLNFMRCSGTFTGHQCRTYDMTCFKSLSCTVAVLILFSLSGVTEASSSKYSMQ